jgi:ADP-heptose:LPS heptosyltransferase
MGKPKGSPKTGGKKKGSTNKLSLSVKEAVWDAFLELQNDPKSNIVNWGKKNLKDFYIISAKLIPVQMTGENGKDLFPALVSRINTPEEKKLLEGE